MRSVLNGAETLSRSPCSKPCHSDSETNISGPCYQLGSNHGWVLNNLKRCASWSSETAAQKCNESSGKERLPCYMIISVSNLPGPRCAVRTQNLTNCVWPLVLHSSRGCCDSDKTVVLARRPGSLQPLQESALFPILRIRRGLQLWVACPQSPICESTER